MNAQKAKLEKEKQAQEEAVQKAANDINITREQEEAKKAADLQLKKAMQEMDKDE